MLRVVEGLTTKLDVWFHEQAITHTMGDLLLPILATSRHRGEISSTFWNAKKIYCNQRPYGLAKEATSTPMVLEILSNWHLDVQQGMFKCGSSHDRNCGPRIWQGQPGHCQSPHTCVASDPWITIVVPCFSWILKGGRDCHGSCIGSIENKQCHKFVAFLKNKVHNCMNNHLHQVVSLNAQKFFSLGTFHKRLHCGQMFN